MDQYMFDSRGGLSGTAGGASIGRVITSVSTERAPPPIASEISEQLSRLRTYLDEISAGLSNVNERLLPVLNPRLQPPSGGTAGGKEEDLSPLATELRALRFHAAGINAHVQGILTSIAV
jgi:hypothetical protein